VRTDFEAMNQIPQAYTGEEEEDLWSGESKPVSEITHSFSGHERNHLFVSDSGRQFSDVSLLSGLDSESDGRVFAATDFDRDGYVDLAIVNSNAPLLQFFRNQIGIQEVRGSSKNAPNKFVAVQLVGGNDTPQASTWSSRDGVGAKICLTTSTRKIYRDHQCGEGLAAQNSSVRIIGCGADRELRELVVTWPSGKTTTIRDLKHGQLLRIFENVDQSPNKDSVVRETYQIKRQSDRQPKHHSVFAEYDSRLDLSHLNLNVSGEPIDPANDLVVITTMATWCKACISHLPQFQLYEQQLADHVTSIGFPIDPTDTAKKLQEFKNSYDVRYAISGSMSDAFRASFVQVLTEHGDPHVLPSTVVTDKQGRVLHVGNGIPSVSKLRSLLSRQNDK
jgi:thiol-disulfide isomerase/thioredoxin